MHCGFALSVRQPRKERCAADRAKRPCAQEKQPLRREGAISWRSDELRLLIIGLVSAGLAALGVRLLRQSRRSGARPEFWLGLAFSFAGSSAWLIPLAAHDGVGSELARGLGFTAQAGMTATVSCLVIFTWKVFRADSSRARWLAGTLIALNLLTGFAVLQSGMPLPVGRIGLAIVVTRNISLLWLFLESTRYAQQMRRRVRLGLGDPILANRFVLWSIWTGALACIPLFVLVLRLSGVVMEPVPGEALPAAVRAIVVVLGVGGATALGAGWLAFFPPAPYRRWIAARAAAVR